MLSKRTTFIAANVIKKVETLRCQFSFTYRGTVLEILSIWSKYHLENEEDLLELDRTRPALLLQYFEEWKLFEFRRFCQRNWKEFSNVNIVLLFLWLLELSRHSLCLEIIYKVSRFDRKLKNIPELQEYEFGNTKRFKHWIQTNNDFVVFHLVKKDDIHLLTCWRYRGYPLQQSEFDRTASAIVCFWSALLSFRQLRWWKSQSANCRRTIILGNTLWQFQRFLNCEFADCLDSSCCFRIHGHEMTLSGWHWRTTGSQTSYLQDWATLFV